MKASQKHHLAENHPPHSDDDDSNMDSENEEGVSSALNQVKEVKFKILKENLINFYKAFLTSDKGFALRRAIQGFG